MKKIVYGFLLGLILVPLAHADVQQGAQELDWKTCVSNKQNECKNACMGSEDINCGDNCQSLAADKCQSEGINPPS